MINKPNWSYVYNDDDYYGNGEVLDEDGCLVAITTGPNYGAYHKDGPQHFEAIARLIAASPDLLEALMEFVTPFDGIEVVQGGLIGKARAAIAKATGQ